jgi:hypothetical protein
MNAILVAVCIITLMFGAFLHGAIPHHDGIIDDHGQVQESPIWQDLHSVLQHEKKSFFLLTESFALIVFSLWVVVAVRTVVFDGRIFLRDPVLGIALRRGTIPHRAFR